MYDTKFDQEGQSQENVPRAGGFLDRGVIIEKLHWGLIVGVFIGNWLVVPLIFRKWRNFKDGFFIGLIAAVLCIIYYAIF